MARGIADARNQIKFIHMAQPKRGVIALSVDDVRHRVQINSSRGARQCLTRRAFNLID
jgi:hypothetical protein